MLQLSQEGTPFAAADPREDCLLEQIHRPTTGISAPREQWAPAALWFCLVGHYVSSTAFLQGGISPLLRATVFRGPTVSCGSTVVTPPPLVRAGEEEGAGAEASW